MSESLLSSDIRQRFDEMRERLACLERSVSPNTESSLSPAARSPSLTGDRALDATALTDRILASLSAERPTELEKAEAPNGTTASDPFAAIQARLVRKLQTMESTRRGFSSASAQALSHSPDLPLADHSPLPVNADDGRSPLSAACTEPKSPSPYIDESTYATRVTSAESPVRDDTCPNAHTASEVDSPMPTAPSAGRRTTIEAVPPPPPRELFPRESSVRASTPVTTTTTTAGTRPRSSVVAAPECAPSLRFSAEATILVKLTTAELLFLLRLRGLIASETETGEDPLATRRCHAMYVSPLEQAQLVRWRAAVAARVTGASQARASPTMSAASTRRAASGSARHAAPSHFAVRHSNRASAPTASSLSKAKKTSYF